MTRWWRDLRAVLTVGVLLVAILAAFPYPALKFSARTVPMTRAASAAFVSLSDEEAEAALRSARTAWQSETTAMQRMRVRLPLGELLEEDTGVQIEIDFGDRSALDGALPVGYQPPAFAPSSAARVVEPSAVKDGQLDRAFSREHLLGFE